MDREGVITETIKTSEEGDSLIVRLYEAAGERGPVTLTTSLPVKKASLADLLENAKSTLPVKQGHLHLNLIPFEIVTLKLEMKRPSEG